jgi:hypothetical protein
MDSTPDVDEDPPPKKPPKFCPWCGRAVVKRWVPFKIGSLYTRPGAKTTYVCLVCKVAVRAFVFPTRPLFETKRAAREQAQCDYDALASSGFRSHYARDQYARGKCACSSYPSAQTYRDPCPLHAPLPKPTRRKRS